MRFIPFSLLALICIVVTLVYAQALNGPLFFDDLPNIVDNEALYINPTSFDDWRVATLSSHTTLLRPVAMISFVSNYVLAGEFVPWQLKLFNLVVHLACGLILFLLVRPLLRAPALVARWGDRADWVAFLAASIWLLHPLHVSTVLYVVQRMAQLSTLFVILGLWLFTHVRLRWAERGAKAGDCLSVLLWLFLLTLFAVLSKENGILLPWLVLALEVFLFSGIWAGRHSPWLQRTSWLLLVLPLLLVALVLLVSPDTFSGRFGNREFTMEQRLLTQGRVLWQYLSWLVWPNVSAMGFHHDDILLSTGLLSPVSTGVALLGWLLVIAAALLLSRRFPLIVFAFCFYLIAHSLESGPLSLELVYEHRNYLPSVAICILMAAGVYRLVGVVDWLKPTQVALAVLGIMGLLLLMRTSAWSDEVSLARRNVINHPSSPRANFFYANALYKELLDQGTEHFSEDERKAYIVTSREYFQKMHQLDSREMAPLIMLYQIDKYFFPNMPDAPDWLGKLTELAGSRRLQASDRTALGALVEFAGQSIAARDRGRITELFGILAARYSNTYYVYGLQYQLLRQAENYDFSDVAINLERINATRPGEMRVYPYLLSLSGNQDKATTYETVRRWMLNDSLRLKLPVIRSMFEHGE